MSEINFTLLKQSLQYDPNTGEFVWIKSSARKIKVGTKAGNQKPNGYIGIQFQRKMYLAHRLAWLITYGKWPIDQIDHINRKRNDNRISNLREVYRFQNLQNKTPSKKNISGVTGVTWNKQKNRWIARIMLNKKSINIGTFVSFEEAVKARHKLEAQIFTHAQPH